MLLSLYEHKQTKFLIDFDKDIAAVLTIEYIGMGNRVRKLDGSFRRGF